MKKTYNVFVEKKNGSFDVNPELIRCCFCGAIVPEIESNIPWPVTTTKKARCCMKCNWRVVIPARMANISSPDEYEMPTFNIIPLGKETSEKPE